jgi:hypothetical protein
MAIFPNKQAISVLASWREVYSVGSVTESCCAAAGPKTNSLEFAVTDWGLIRLDPSSGMGREVDPGRRAAFAITFPRNR